MYIRNWDCGTDLQVSLCVGLHLYIPPLHFNFFTLIPALINFFYTFFLCMKLFTVFFISFWWFKYRYRSISSVGTASVVVPSLSVIFSGFPTML